MTDEGSLERAIHEEVRIVPHDPERPLRYEDERNRLLALFPGSFAGIEHVGSTALPGLAAKPILDLIGGVRSMAEEDALLPAICRNGYTPSAEFNAMLGDQRLYRRENGVHRRDPACAQI